MGSGVTPSCWEYVPYVREQKDKWMEGRTDDGWLDGWKEGWVDGWMDVCLRAYLLAAQIVRFPRPFRKRVPVSPPVYSTVSV